LLKETKISHVTIIIFISIDNLILHHHEEFVYVEAVRLSNLNSQVTNCLEVAYLNLFLDVVWAEENHERKRLEIIKVILLHLCLKCLFAFVTIKQLREKLEGVAHKCLIL